MQTRFTEKQRQDPDIVEAEAILRRCVHCGFCTATCPTYNLLGDERDSPRGRISMIQSMLEDNRPPQPAEITHIDRCLSCLSCMTTCPSGVHYMHLVDHARAYIEKSGRRPLGDRALRRLLGAVMTQPALTRLAAKTARLFRPLAPALARGPLLLRRLAAMLELAPSRLPKINETLKSGTQGYESSIKTNQDQHRRRVSLLAGCVQNALDSAIHQATVALLQRLGFLVSVDHNGCCGALQHHLGDAEAAHKHARKAIASWSRALNAAAAEPPAEAIIVNASGCGTNVKDYGFIFRNHPTLADPAQTVSRKTRDLSEFLVETKALDALSVPTSLRPDIQRLRVACHIPCSMLHGQKIGSHPLTLLQKAGFQTQTLPEAHLCCGSAGSYNILQPDIAQRLAERKKRHIEDADIHLVATGNLGCLMQLKDRVPTLHYVELLNWAYGGDRPAALADAPAAKAPASRGAAA